MARWHFLSFTWLDLALFEKRLDTSVVQEVGIPPNGASKKYQNLSNQEAAINLRTNKNISKNIWVLQG